MNCWGSEGNPDQKSAPGVDPVRLPKKEVLLQLEKDAHHRVDFYPHGAVHIGPHEKTRAPVIMGKLETGTQPRSEPKGDFLPLKGKMQSHSQGNQKIRLDISGGIGLGVYPEIRSPDESIPCCTST